MKKTAFIYIITAGILWGTSGIFVHYMAPLGFSSLQMTFFRSIVSAVALFIYILIKDKNLIIVKPKELLLCAGSGISFFLTASCYFYSMQATSVSTAVILMYTAPVFVLIYSVAFLGEKLNKTKIAAVLCMFIGCGLISGIIGGLKFDLFGIVMGFISGIAYSAYNIFTKIQMSNKANPFSATLYCFVIATIVGFFSCNPSDIPVIIMQDAKVTIPLCIFLGICTCVLPYFLYTIALKVLPAGTASALGIIEPMAATLFSVILFAEPLDISSVCGIVLILGSVFALSANKE